jgi:hypothetical protein
MLRPGQATGSCELLSKRADPLMAAQHLELDEIFIGAAHRTIALLARSRASAMNMLRAPEKHN